MRLGTESADFLNARDRVELVEHPLHTRLDGIGETGCGCP